MANMLIAVLVMVLILGGPFTLYAAIKIISQVFGKPSARFVRGAAGGESPLALLIDWDNESFPQAIRRVKVEYTELHVGGRSTQFSVTLEDRAARKKSFLLPLKLASSDLEMLTDNKALDAQVIIEIENIEGNVVRKEMRKAQLLDAIQSPSVTLDPQSVDTLPAAQPDVGGIYSRAFPWKKKAEEPAAPTEKKAAAPAAAGAAAPAKTFDFQITKVWIEPGCIVCDACENEAPDVFKVLADTCIVVDNAPLGNTGSIVAAAEGCPVNVIKYDTKKIA